MITRDLCISVSANEVIETFVDAVLDDLSDLPDETGLIQFRLSLLNNDGAREAAVQQIFNIGTCADDVMFYCADPERNWKAGGVGVCEVDNEPLNYYCMWPFNATEPTLIVLRLELFDNTLLCHVNSAQRVQAVSDLIRFRKVLAGSVVPPKWPAIPSTKRRSLTPNWNEWQARVNAAQNEIKSGTIDKVVLSRKSRYRSSDMSWLDPVKLFKNNPMAQHFYCRRGKQSFISLSPERLVTVDSGRVLVDAVAGTRPRGNNSAEDDRLASELLSSAKDRKEHEYVVNHVERVLEEFCTGTATSEIRVAKHARVQHLKVNVTGELRNEAAPLALVRALHPTPATCGFPIEPAMKHLVASGLEADRGMYAGTCGVISADAAHMIVGIRCASIEADTLELRAGCGIVDGSTARDEWKELNAKVSFYEAELARHWMECTGLAISRDLPVAHALVDELVRLGIKNFFVCPGARSAALAVAVCRTPGALLKAHYDERSAGFAAMGCALGLARPACIITTSGTAVANLLPAIIEARTSHIPLLILTADRPLQLQDCGANQTIRQEGIFGQYVCFEKTLVLSDDLCHALSLIDYAAHTATQTRSPVHINIRCEDPGDSHSWLFNHPTVTPITPITPITRHSEHLVDWILTNEPYLEYTDSVDRLYSAISGRRGLVVVGNVAGANINALLSNLSRCSNVLVYRDISSGMLGVHGDETTFRADLLLGNTAVFRRFCEELDFVLQLGDKIVSKSVNRLVETSGLPFYLAVNHGDRVDQYANCRLCFVGGFPQCDANSFCRPFDPAWDSFVADVQLWNKIAATAVSTCCANELQPLSEAQVVLTMSHLITHTMFIGNSGCIRDFNSYADRPLQVYCARGASGIDGQISTACGLACNTNRAVTAIFGDLTFLHDTNGLFMLKQCPVIVVVVNNSGGQIFRKLAPLSTLPPPIMNAAFVVEHDVSLMKLTAAHHIRHVTATTATELRAAYRAAIDALPSPTVIEAVASARDVTRRINETISSSISMGIKCDFAGNTIS